MEQLFVQNNKEKVMEILQKVLPFWGERALEKVQGRAKVRKLLHLPIKQMERDIAAGKDYGVYFAWGGGVPRAYGTDAKTTCVLCAYYAVGLKIFIGIGVGRVWVSPGQKEQHAVETMYWEMTGGGTPPVNEDLLARAIGNPQRARAMEALDLRRQNMQAIAQRFGNPLSREIARKIKDEKVKLSHLKKTRKGIAYKGRMLLWLR